MGAYIATIQPSIAPEKRLRLNATAAGWKLQTVLSSYIFMNGFASQGSIPVEIIRSKRLAHHFSITVDTPQIRSEYASASAQRTCHDATPQNSRHVMYGMLVSLKGKTVNPQSSYKVDGCTPFGHRQRLIHAL
ncbi:hypothetical protein LPH55_09430 [Xylella taiwanensis]|uniref:Uncharacterized protein n=1 Tax=Xylella taiwanensis TaxID=1444770 RepID=A0ABS8TU67_9GAMM|nr:hypothetical protein [Xylella taiwanensis]MCD8458734.1 hypothetical protein [Xylella taiwanensis]MCD8473669.1 hypothetical protein [Xylella taiwanensis]